MRLLWARVGIPYSPATGLPIESQSVSQMADRVASLPEGSRLLLMAPVVRGRKGEYRKELRDYQRRGFQRVKIDGELYDIEEAPALRKNVKHDIAIVVDRIAVRPDLGNRLADSLETALELADGLASVEDVRTGESILFSARFACPVSGFTIEEIEPRLFSFNNPAGACPACDGLGSRRYIDEALVVPDDGLSMRRGAIAPWKNTTAKYYQQTLRSLARHYDVETDTPWRELPPEVRGAVPLRLGERAGDHGL